jgi:hypothetical protein
MPPRNARHVVRAEAGPRFFFPDHEITAKASLHFRGDVFDCLRHSVSEAWSGPRNDGELQADIENQSFADEKLRRISAMLRLLARCLPCAGSGKVFMQASTSPHATCIGHCKIKMVKNKNIFLPQVFRNIAD